MDNTGTAGGGEMKANLCKTCKSTRNCPRGIDVIQCVWYEKKKGEK